VFNIVGPKVLGKATLECPELNQLALRNILEEVLYDYELQPKTTALVPMADILDKIVMFLASKRLDGLSNVSIYNYGLHLRRFAQYTCKNVADITTMDIRRYLAHLMQQGLKNTSIETEKSIQKSFFNWLENEEYIIKSPARKIKPSKTEKRLRKALDDEELERLRDACSTPRQRALLEFIFSTGCRLSEAVNVDIADINWNECSLKVIGKGNKEREVQFSKKARLYLKKYIATRGDISNPALFITERKPYKRLGNRAVEREISKVAKLAGIDKAVYPHLLRHTMATMGLRSGASLQTIQTLLGHSSPNTTEIYAEISNESVKEEYRRHMIQ
jgi:integrase/recombinase XerD